MVKSAPKLTKIQLKALDFIRTSVERSGTAPTLRELCSYMGYSAIGSAQDLVSALRRKGFLHTPERQSARSLILTSKALALHEPMPQSSDSTFVVPCLDYVPPEFDPGVFVESKVCSIKFSTTMFERPYPEAQKLFGIKLQDDSMAGAGLFPQDWVMVHAQTTADEGEIVVARLNQTSVIRRLMKDDQGWYYKPENTNFPILRPSEGEPLEISGKVIALQRVL